LDVLILVTHPPSSPQIVRGFLVRQKYGKSVTNARKRVRVVREMYETETAYLRNLQVSTE